MCVALTTRNGADVRLTKEVCVLSVWVILRGTCKTRLLSVTVCRAQTEKHLSKQVVCATASYTIGANTLGIFSISRRALRIAARSASSLLCASVTLRRG